MVGPTELKANHDGVGAAMEWLSKLRGLEEVLGKAA